MKRHPIKSCCGSRSYLFELDAPISKEALKIFKDAGYAVNDVYTRVGVFHVEKSGLIANGSFGGMKIQVRCSGSANCGLLLDHLENTFKIISAPKP
jgi:hypothetical protein